MESILYAIGVAIVVLVWCYAIYTGLAKVTQCLKEYWNNDNNV